MISPFVTRTDILMIDNQAGLLLLLFFFFFLCFLGNFLKLFTIFYDLKCLRVIQLMFCFICGLKGAYRDDNGKPVVLDCVREAERRIAGNLNMLVNALLIYYSKVIYHAVSICK